MAASARASSSTKSPASVPKRTSRLPVSCASATAKIRWIALPSIRNRYPVGEQIPRALDTPVGELIANPQVLTKVDACQIDAGAFTVKDILEELRKPGRDPREQFVAPSFNEI